MIDFDFTFLSFGVNKILLFVDYVIFIKIYLLGMNSRFDTLSAKNTLFIVLRKILAYKVDYFFLN